MSNTEQVRALLALAQANVPVDIQELLVSGNPAMGVAPGALAKAISAALEGEAVPVQCCMCGKTGLSTTEGDGGTECQLSDGRWTCSQDCYYTAVDWFSPSSNADRLEGVDKDSLYFLRSFANMYRSGAQGSSMDCVAAQTLALSIDDALRALTSPDKHEDDKRVGELEAALKPFADQAETFDSLDGREFVPDQFEPAIIGHTIGDLRRARAALVKPQGDGE